MYLFWGSKNMLGLYMDETLQNNWFLFFSRKDIKSFQWLLNAWFLPGNPYPLMPGIMHCAGQENAGYCAIWSYVLGSFAYEDQL